MRVRQWLVSVAVGVSIATVADAQDSARTVHDTVFVARTTVVQTVTQLAPKEPGLGFVLGIVIPGGGQFYAGEPTGGTLALLGTVGAFAAGIASAPKACYLGCGSNPQSGALAWTAAGAGLWLVSAIIAPFEVNGWNREHAMRVTAVPSAHGGVVGVSLAF